MSKVSARLLIAAWITAVTISGSVYGYLSVNNVCAAALSKAGDADGNATVDASDCVLFRNYMLVDNVSVNTANMDISGDGMINITDYCMMKNLIIDPPSQDPPASGTDPSEYMNKIRSDPFYSKQIIL